MRTPGILRRHAGYQFGPKVLLIEIRSNKFEISTNFVVAMLRRHEGASGPQIAEAMGWVLHTSCSDHEASASVACAATSVIGTSDVVNLASNSAAAPASMAGADDA